MMNRRTIFLKNLLAHKIPIPSVICLLLIFALAAWALKDVMIFIRGVILVGIWVILIKI
jgi:hypothetical protein